MGQCESEEMTVEKRDKLKREEQTAKKNRLLHEKRVDQGLSVS